MVILYIRERECTSSEKITHYKKQRDETMNNTEENENSDEPDQEDFGECPRCGEELFEESRYCHKCGEQVIEDD